MDIMRIHNLFNLFAKGGVVAGEVTVPTKRDAVIERVKLSINFKYSLWLRIGNFMLKSEMLN